MKQTKKIKLDFAHQKLSRSDKPFLLKYVEQTGRGMREKKVTIEEAPKHKKFEKSTQRCKSNKLLLFKSFHLKNNKRTSRTKLEQTKNISKLSQK